MEQFAVVWVYGQIILDLVSVLAFYRSRTVFGRKLGYCPSMPLQPALKDRSSLAAQQNSMNAILLVHTSDERKLYRLLTAPGGWSFFAAHTARLDFTSEAMDNALQWDDYILQGTSLVINDMLAIDNFTVSNMLEELTQDMVRDS